jgi:hypothetical protein
LCCVHACISICVQPEGIGQVCSSCQLPTLRYATQTKLTSTLRNGSAVCRCCPQAPTQAPASSAQAGAAPALTASATLAQLVAGGKAAAHFATAAHVAGATHSPCLVGLQHQDPSHLDRLGLEAAQAPGADPSSPATQPYQELHCLAVALDLRHPHLQGGHPGRSPHHEAAPPTTQSAGGCLAVASLQPQLPLLQAASPRLLHLHQPG